MSREYVREYAAVMLAYADGKTIQYRKRYGVPSVTVSESEWSDHQSPQWDWSDFEYRVKPEPMETIAWEKENKLYFPQYHNPNQQWETQGYRRVLLREVF